MRASYLCSKLITLAAGDISDTRISLEQVRDWITLLWFQQQSGFPQDHAQDSLWQT